MARRKPKSEEELRFNVVLGTRIEMARKRAGLSQSELAAAIEISQSQVMCYESGEHRCPPFRLSRIADTLGVELAKLVPKITTPNKSREAGCAIPKTV